MTPCCAFTTTPRPATPTRSACCWRSSGRRSSGSNTTSTTARRARRSSCATRTRTAASRCWSWTTARCLPESNAILWYLAEGTRFLPPTTGRWQRAQVLQWMFFEQYSHEPNIATVRFWITHDVRDDAATARPPCPAKRKRGRRRAGGDGAAPRARAASSSASATPSPTSRSTRTRTSRTRAASTSRPSPPCAPGWRASRRSPATSPSPTDGRLRADRDFSVTVRRPSRARRLDVIARESRASPSRNHARATARGRGTRVATPARRCGVGPSPPGFSSPRSSRAVAMICRRDRPRRTTTPTTTTTTSTSGALCASGQICTLAGTGIPGDGQDGLPALETRPVPAAGHDGRPGRTRCSSSTGTTTASG